MRVEVATRGISIASDDGRVRLVDGCPSVGLVDRGESVTWSPRSGTARDGGLEWRSDSHGLCIRTAVDEVDGRIRLRVRVVNESEAAVGLERVALIERAELVVGGDRSRWRCYRNGYQSWSGTTTLGATDRDRDVPTRFGRTSATDARHPAPTERGHVRSDWLGAVVDPMAGDALAVGFLTMADAFGFVETTADGRLSVWADFDGTHLTPGASTPELVVDLVAVTDDPTAGWRALRSVAESAGEAMSARSLDRPHPSGWCSWYFYFAKVTEADVLENLGVLATDGRGGTTFGCEYVMVDDGHQREIGDWLDTDPVAFPSGMASLAERIGAAGFDGGIWWAPFIVSARSTVARDHPEWLVRNGRGRPVLALLNPNWGLANRMLALDTTHPAVLEHLSTTAAAIAAWGYRIQKLDFLYAAALPGVRHDASATRAAALRRGLDAVRAGAGDDAFLLGCGCPLGPAVGVVDAMRIGADVTPYWSNAIDATVGRGLHALATRNAVRNTLTRSVLDRAWWLNDPDCLMVREADTRLTLDEVQVLCTVFGMTDGMVVLSDRLRDLGPDRVELVARTHELAGGHAIVVDLFERDLPELLVSAHDEHTYIGVLNLTDETQRKAVDLARLGIDPMGIADEVVEWWTGSPIPISDGVADLGPLPPHSARVLRIRSSTTG